MNKIIFLGLICTIGTLYAFVRSNSQKTYSSDKCGCLSVKKINIKTNREDSWWYEKVCDSYDKYQGKNKLDEKYKKIYSGTEFKIETGWTGDAFCK